MAKSPATSHSSMPPAKGQNVFAKILIIAVASFFISGMVTWVIALAIAELPELRGAIGRENYDNVLFLVFLTGFGLSIGASSYAFISKEELTGQAHVKRFEAAETNLWKETLKPPKLTKVQKEALRRQNKRRAEEEARLINQMNEEEAELEDVLAESMDNDEVLELPETATFKISVSAEKQKVMLMSFLSRGLEAVMKSKPKLDTFSRFGVSLYLAGACEAMGQLEELDSDDLQYILIDCVGVLGTNREQATKFTETYEDYLRNPKYLDMIEAGREAMQTEMRSNADAAIMLDKALDQWTTRKTDDQPATSTIAVMFTDIVGSTAMTQNLGDAAAQEVVRTHNRIVRAALTSYQGREVKHTGDGIMASFVNTTQAVEAAIYIQRKTFRDNASNPSVPLGIKIGINAGEPIVEDDDLFGTTVQLAARIVDKAANYQIFVSETVRGICQGKTINLQSRGTREMKGFKEPISIFEAIWRTGAELAPAETPASAPAGAQSPQAATSATA
ncbi:MAG: adenylate/guanylate cyclase domain-containing protein [Pseudomonadota bacterium]|nr:adenylate/guanylate cyclase domain-containing protein [Pseudomonadota bacterium]